jgi:hypothetical protein
MNSDSAISAAADEILEWNRLKGVPGMEDVANMHHKAAVDLMTLAFLMESIQAK